MTHRYLVSRRDGRRVSWYVSGHVSGQGATMADEAHWLSYVELADRLGITVASAKRRVHRANWTRRDGNDGTVRVLVPSAVLSAASSADKGADTSADTSAGEGLIERLKVAEMQAAELRARLDERGVLVDELRRRAEAGEALRDQLRDELRVERERAEIERRALQEALAVSEGRLDQLHRERRAEVEAVASERDELRSLVEELRRPWWRRLIGRS